MKFGVLQFLAGQSGACRCRPFMSGLCSASRLWIKRAMRPCGWPSTTLRVQCLSLGASDGHARGRQTQHLRIGTGISPAPFYIRCAWPKRCVARRTLRWSGQLGAGRGLTQRSSRCSRAAAQSQARFSRGRGNRASAWKKSASPGTDYWHFEVSRSCRNHSSSPSAHLDCGRFAGFGLLGAPRAIDHVGPHTHYTELGQNARSTEGTGGTRPYHCRTRSSMARLLAVAETIRPPRPSRAGAPNGW